MATGHTTSTTTTIAGSLQIAIQSPSHPVNTIMNASVSDGGVRGSDSADVVVNISTKVVHKLTDDGTSGSIASGRKARAKRGPQKQHKQKQQSIRFWIGECRVEKDELIATISRELGREIGKNTNKLSQLSWPLGME